MKRSLLAVIAVLVVGCDGPVGAPGPEGPRGPAGPQGPSGSVAPARVRHCVGTIGGGVVKYNRVIYPSGDVLTSCYYGDSSRSYSNMEYWPVGTIGARDGTCFLTYDLDANTGGYWTFTTIGGITSATYTDSGSPANGTIIGNAACTEQ